jgi:hypothetical protein
MTNRSHRTFAITLAIVMAGSATALAAGPLHGKTYEGGAPSSGIDSEGHRQRTHATGNVILRVTGSGRSVSVRFSSSSPVLYCSTQERVHVQSTKPAPISRSGSFKATVDERFAAGPGASSMVQVVTGQFSGHTVRGTIRTQAAECSGSASYSATAH